MATRYPYQQQYRPQQQQQMQEPLVQRVAKAIGATMAGGTMSVLSALTLVATVIGLIVVTPVLVIFSPVLVPAAITVFLITLGFVAAAAFGLAALSVASWVYRYVTGKMPLGARTLDKARMTLAGKAWDVKEGIQHSLAGEGEGAPKSRRAVS